MVLAAAVLAWACNPLGHCSPGYDDRLHHVSVCDGNIAAGHDEVCSEVSNETSNDCGAQKLVCLGGACVKPCTADGDCPATSYCKATPDAWDHRNTCQPRGASGASCSDTPSACSEGNVCQNGVCREDCSKIDQAMQTCPKGAQSFCEGKAVRTCDECGVPKTVTTTCADPSFCVTPATDAFCSIEQDVDPKCGTKGYTTYCAGSTFVECQEGYVTHRVSCPVETACSPTGCTMAR